MTPAAAWLTVQIATAATVLATLVAVPAAWWFCGRRGVPKTVVETLLLLPLVMPPTVVGLALGVVLGRNGPLGWVGFSLLFTPTAAVLAGATVALPLVYLAEPQCLCGRR